MTFLFAPMLAAAMAAPAPDTLTSGAVLALVSETHAKVPADETNALFGRPVGIRMRHTTHADRSRDSFWIQSDLGHFEMPERKWRMDDGEERWGDSRRCVLMAPSCREEGDGSPLRAMRAIVSEHWDLDAMTHVRVAGFECCTYRSGEESGPGFHRVYWPTLGTALLSEVAFIGLVFSADEIVAAAFVLTVPPAVMAKVMGGSFVGGLLGSAAGIGVGYGLYRVGIAGGIDDSEAFWAIPITHALLTTLVSRYRR